MLLVLQLILLTDYSILNGIRVDSIPSITEKAVRIPPRTAFYYLSHTHTFIFRFSGGRNFIFDCCPAKPDCDNRYCCDAE